MNALRSREQRRRERGCFFVEQTLWAEKIRSTTDAGWLNTFGRNEIEVARMLVAFALGIVFTVRVARAQDLQS